MKFSKIFHETMGNILPTNHEIHETHGFPGFSIILNILGNVKFREVYGIDRPSIAEYVKFREFHDLGSEVIFVVPGMYLDQIQ